ncbi:MAG: hypothetical protein PT965_09760, partial [Clostridia bacterium]|nr:hypothetical protein [Clostridia bacterium]
MKRYSGKHTRASAPRRGLVLAAALALTLIFSAGGTLAWLAASTEETVNTFSPAQMEIEVKEKFDGEIKQNVRVENKSETAVYIRVALVPTWVNAEGEPMAQSASLDDLTFTNLPANGWVKHGNYYYYTNLPASEVQTLFQSFITDPSSLKACFNQISKITSSYDDIENAIFSSSNPSSQ